MASRGGAVEGSHDDSAVSIGPRPVGQFRVEPVHAVPVRQRDVAATGVDTLPPPSISLRRRTPGMEEWMLDPGISIALIVAVGVLQRFLYDYDHKWIHDRYDALLSHDRDLSSSNQSALIRSGWYSAFFGALGTQCVLFVSWLIVGSFAQHEGIRLTAYLIAFYTTIGIFGFCLEASVLYRAYRRRFKPDTKDSP